MNKPLRIILLIFNKIKVPKSTGLECLKKIIYYNIINIKQVKIFK